MNHHASGGGIDGAGGMVGVDGVGWLHTAQRKPLPQGGVCISGEGSPPAQRSGMKVPNICSGNKKRVSVLSIHLMDGGERGQRWERWEGGTAFHGFHGGARRGARAPSPRFTRSRCRGTLDGFNGARCPVIILCRFCIAQKTRCIVQNEVGKSGKNYQHRKGGGGVRPRGNR